MAGLRSYTPEFRQAAVAMVVSQGVSTRGAAARLGIPYFTLTDWVGTHEEARLAVFEWFEVWYQRTRAHGSLGYFSPEAFEAAARAGWEGDGCPRVFWKSRAGFPRNVLGTILHNPDTSGPFLEFWVTAKSRMSLTVREQELVILRMAVLYRSGYVWKHHVPVGREFGVSEDEFDAVEAGDYSAFARARERALLALTDELVEARTIGREAWDAHAPVLDDRGLVDLVSLVSQYVFFALMNNAFQVEVEPALARVRALR